MTTTPKPEVGRFVVSAERMAKLRRIARMAKLRRIAREANARLGIPEKPIITAAELRERMRANGIRPKDNILSRELLRMRYGDDYDQGEYMRNLDKHILDAQNIKE